MIEENISNETSSALPAVRTEISSISKGATRSVVLDIEKGDLQAKEIIVPCSIVKLEEKASLITLEDWTSIRWLHFREKKSIRWIAKEFKISRKTVAKYLEEPEGPKYKLSRARARPVVDQWLSLVQEILASDKDAPRKQRHTARRIYQRLVEEASYGGSERTIRQLVSDLKNKPARNASVPLLFEPGADAQVDFGESYADIDGQRMKFHGFEMRLNYSRKKFIQYFPSTDKEAFLEGHVRAFEHFNGVVARLTYDNLGAGVAQVKKGKDRVLTREFKELKGYYNFETNFCKPGIEGAHEKGGVESGIGFSRRNWMVPVPAFASLKELNEHILQKCVADDERTVDGENQTIGQAWGIEQPLLLSLPTRPFDPAVHHGGLVDSYCTVPLKDSHYSVPAKYVGRGLTIRAYWDRLEITDGLTLIAKHQRTYKKDEYVLEPAHYLELLESRPHAVPYARPLLQHIWPVGYWEFYKKMVQEFGPGTAGRDFIRILKSHMKYGADIVGKAVEESMQIGGTSADFVIAMIDRHRLTTILPEQTDIDIYPQLSGIKVTICPSPDQYQRLLVAQRGMDNDEERTAQ